MPGVPPAEPTEKPHDVLAAEEFAMPAVYPELHSATVRLPDDPSGNTEAHDILAAEEFAIPAPRSRPGAAPSLPSSRKGRATGVLLGLLAVVLLARLLRR
jgi:hypothetical protein